MIHVAGGKDASANPLSGALLPLLLGSAAIFFLTAFASLFLHGPQIHADEGSYLLNAATISGALRDGLVSGYYAGYSLFLVPAFLIWSEPASIYHAALVLNALLVASTPFAIYRLTRLLWPDLDARAHATASVAVTCYAPLLLLTQYAMSENVLVPLYAWLLAGGATLLFRPRSTTGILCGCLTGTLLLVHPRGAVMALPILIVLSAFGVRQRPLRWPLVAMWIAGIAIASLHVPLELLADKVGKSSGGYSARAMLVRLFEFKSWFWIVANLIGATTEATVGSIGLLVVGLRAVADNILAAVKGGDWREYPRAAVLFAAVCSLGLSLMVTATFFVPPTRADQLAYGRYALPTLLPLLAFGILRLHASPDLRTRDAMWAIGAGVAGIAVMAVVFDGLPATIATNWNFINAIGLHLAYRFGPFDDPWMSIGAAFITGAFLVYFCGRNSARYSILTFVAINLAVALVAWCVLTWAGSNFRASGRAVIDAAHVYEAQAGSPLCIRFGVGVDTWHRMDLGWRIWPQLAIRAQPTADCVAAVIQPTRRKPPPGMRLVATERPSPIGSEPVGLFVESGASLAAFARKHPLPPQDAIDPLPTPDRLASISVMTSLPLAPLGVGSTVDVKVHVENRGSRIWSAVTDEYLPYPVRIGATANLGPRTESAFRSALPRDLGPGQSEDATLTLGPFRRPGHYRIRLGIVQEHVAWFPNNVEFLLRVVGPPH